MEQKITIQLAKDMISREYELAINLLNEREPPTTTKITLFLPKLKVINDKTISALNYCLLKQLLTLQLTLGNYSNSIYLR
ncbi:MAG: hypothetical protein KJ771_08830 [Nanoarchaeota archaeon]|nr:hypothetical protein [Nanoarchaeota archaeon]